MNTQEFFDSLNESDLEVTFTKKSDGKERTIRCTKNYPATSLAPDKVSKIKPEGLVTVYDTDIKQWRSLYVDSITEVKKLDTRFGLIQE